ncbi:MAG TPA: Spy/CpxP family protein refolding chaperone [Phycisphaerales bacterium]|nr:Spy/CpxP family protein refolding chaperone [Phycisphaerales bacterium]
MRASGSWRFVGGAVVLVSLAGTVFAQGQPAGQPEGQQRQRMRDRGNGGAGGGGGFGMFRNALEKPALNERDLEAALSGLNLTEDQREAVTALVDGYQEQAEQAAQQSRQARQGAMEAMRDGGPAAAAEAWQKTAEDQKKWRTEREKLDASLLSDVQSVLTPDQTSKWDSARRQIVRAQSMRQGLLSGERVDVLVLVNKLELTEQDREQLRPVLDQYELDIEREIAARDRVTNEAVNSFEPAQLFDPEKREDLTKRMEARREASEKVREVNSRFAKQVAALLPEAPRAQFDRAYKEASFPDVYRTTQAGRALTAAEGFGDLTEDQRLAIADLHDSYTAQVEQLRPRLEQATIEVEKNFSIANALNGMGPGQRMRGQEGRNNQPDPQRELRQERRELDEKALADLKKILSVEQAARLPEPDQGEQQRRQRGNGGQGRANSPDGA